MKRRQHILLYNLFHQEVIRNLGWLSLRISLSNIYLFCLLTSRRELDHRLGGVTSFWWALFLLFHYRIYHHTNSTSEAQSFHLLLTLFVSLLSISRLGGRVFEEICSCFSLSRSAWSWPWLVCFEWVSPVVKKQIDSFVLLSREMRSYVYFVVFTELDFVLHCYVC